MVNRADCLVELLQGGAGHSFEGEVVRESLTSGIRKIEIGMEIRL